MQQVLDAALERCPGSDEGSSPLRADRWVRGTPRRTPHRSRDGATAEAERRLSTDPSIGSALDRLDQYARWEPGTARHQVAPGWHGWTCATYKTVRTAKDV